MRLWSLHPEYLDKKGLVALWREGLLAKAVLEGKTHGYRMHPQLVRFRETKDPVLFISAYLVFVFEEARHRGHRFDAGKIPDAAGNAEPMPVTDGQLAYEWCHLLNKVQKRDRARYERLRAVSLPEPHPLFYITRGPVAAWEKIH